MTGDDADMLQVFIENEAGSREKKIFDERTHEQIGIRPVSAAYPFAYGFVIGTSGGDGDAVDCFVITTQPLRSGTTIACRPIALLEKIEDGAIDHKVIAAPKGDSIALSQADETALRTFVAGVFSHVSGKTTTVGRMLGREDAQDYVRRSRP